MKCKVQDLCLKMVNEFNGIPLDIISPLILSALSGRQCDCLRIMAVATLFISTKTNTFFQPPPLLVVPPPPSGLQVLGSASDLSVRFPLSRSPRRDTEWEGLD